MIDTSQRHPGLRPGKLSVTVLALVAICLFTSVTKAQDPGLGCAANCESCSGSGSGQCNSCTVVSGKVLQTGNCVDSCSTGFTVDARDRICKKTQVTYDFPCAPGTYNDQAGQSLTSACQACLPGMFCSGYALATAEGNCDPGFYCTASSTLRTPVASYASLDNAVNDVFLAAQGDVCPEGKYCPTTSASPTDCDGGYYCDNKGDASLATAKQCAAGYYCSSGSKSPTPNGVFSTLQGVSHDTTGNICPFGKFCAVKTAVPIECGVGTFISYQGAQALAECIPCTDGKYCEISSLQNPTGDCTQGYYCAVGSTSASQTRCDQDSYCPTGTVTMKLCPLGQYTVGTGNPTCSVCPAGQTCRGTGTTTPCLNGYTCNNDITTPCPQGTFMEALTGQSDPATCTACTAGFSCQTPNLKGECAQGFYCSGPNGGTVGAKTGVPNSVANQLGAMCIPGQYCGVGSSSATSCDPGFFCHNYKASQVSGQCSGGYYCPQSGSLYPDQTLCPQGNFCPPGSITPTQCPIGTYGPSQGATDVTACIACPPGVYCSTTGLVGVPSTSTNNCAAGFYCNPASTTSAPVPCSKGYMCPIGTQFQIVCPTGTYQPLTQKSTCDDCPAGSYCDGTDSSKSTICPRGYYCPLNTKFSNQYPCPAGTYGSSTGLSAETQCLKCTDGYFCQFKAQTQQLTKIIAGYHANGVDGQTIPNPYLCPQMMFCPEGSKMAQMCPDGYWTPYRGAKAQTECITCPRGMWCKFSTMFAHTDFRASMVNIAGMQSFTLNTAGTVNLQAQMAVFLQGYYGPCDPGYICLEGAISSMPGSIAAQGGYPCEVGHYCPSGVTVQQPCRPGTYNNAIKQFECLQCPIGMYCPNFGMTAGIACLQGYFCPVGMIHPQPCPAGTFSNSFSLQKSQDCTACTAQYFCGIVGQTKVTDTCTKGFVCVGGDTNSAPYVTPYKPSDSTGGAVSGRCPQGAYCETGEDTPISCPPKTYLVNDQNSVCLTCPPGYYCVGGIANKVPCQAGHYCTEKSAIQNPTKASDGGGVCPVQHFCVEGTSEPIICPDGTIQDKTGQHQCDLCPPGFTCKAGVQEKCSTYRVCDQKVATEFPYGKLCPGGTYSNDTATGFSKTSDCTICPAKQFCAAGRKVGECASGYICLDSADAHKPNISQHAYACPSGYYCGQGAQKPIRCPVGTFTMTVAAKQVTECTACQPGFYCPSENVEPQQCPPGAYCPYDSSQPLLCPKGTFNPKNMSMNLADCEGCLGGYFCNLTGLGNVVSYGNKYLCPLGSYCPTGNSHKPIPCLAGTFFDNGTLGNESVSKNLATSINSCQFCPEHYYCTKGTGFRYEYPCPDGSECPLGSGDVIPCSPGFFCKNIKGKVEKLICPQGFYCPMGTGIPKQCGPGDTCAEGSASAIAGGQKAKDCLPGQYLFINKCKSCEPGFVCDKFTNQKYPTENKTEGGTECPAGFYCPGGSTTKTAKPCPVGTFRFDTGAKKLEDCTVCLDGSATNLTGSIQCIICGSGSNNNFEKTTCECNGAFRTWQMSTNACVCRTGFEEPTVTQSTQNSANDLDCKPILQPTCPPTSFVNEFNECVSKSSCNNYYKCKGKAGSFDETLNQCFCNDVSSLPTAYCDATCKTNALKAYLLQNGKILLTAGQLNKTYPGDIFGSSMSFIGQKCPVDRCAILNVYTDSTGNQISSGEAAEPFVQVWKQFDPKYKSPYGNFTTRALSESSRRDTRDLQATASSTAKPIQSSIKCIGLYDSVSFQVSASHFPVYMVQSIYNTDPSYDYGAFTQLKTNLVNSNLGITTFMNIFAQEGVFVFGDHATPTQYQTIILVTSDSSVCAGETSYPITAANMKKLGISPTLPVLKSYDNWLHIIPPFFIVLAFFVIYAQHKIEQGIEARELEARIKREGNSIDMKKYFKKAQDKFDKLEYLGDLYKLIEENLAEINKKIAENDRLTEEENRDNMKKMLQDKHSLLTELRKGKGDQDLEDIRSNLTSMLGNLRFQDGRSLEEMFRDFQKKEQEAKDQARIERIDQIAALDEESDEKEFNTVETVEKNRDIEMEAPEEGKDSDAPDQEIMADPALYDDLLKAKEQIKQNRSKFLETLDKSLSDSERLAIMNRFDDQMRAMEQQLAKEQEDQAGLFKAKLAQRNKLHQQVIQVVAEDIKHQTDQVADLQRQVDDLHQERDEIEEIGINSRGLKKEREAELKLRMTEIDKESDSRLSQMREDYMNRIKATSDSSEKEKILQEMGQRIKATEENLAEDRKRQEANLMKLLRARQKKNLKSKVKEIDKQAELLYLQVDVIKTKISEHKANVYAEQGTGSTAPGLVDQEIAMKRDRIIGLTTQTQEMNFNNELTREEQGDIDIQKAQLDMLKDQELKAIEVQVEEELESQIRLKKQEMETQRVQLQIKIKQASSEKDRQALLEQLSANDKAIQKDLDEQKQNQTVLFEVRKRRKADRMQVRKMRIEMDQLTEISEKELALNTKKFLTQMEEMDKVTNANLTKEVKDFMRPDQKNKEQSLILISETNDEILQKKLKLLNSKQFFDLSKLMSTMHQQVALDQMIKIKEIHLRFDLMKDEASRFQQGTDLEDALLKIQAERDLEVTFVDESIEKSLVERDSQVKLKQEEIFCRERKDLIQKQNQAKRAQIAAVLAKYPQELTLQNVGVKLLKRIDMTLEQEIAELEKEKEEKLERARLRIIAENEDEVQLMQDNLNKAMQKEELAMNEQLQQRKADIMAVKKQNLEDRMKLATQEMSDLQIDNLRKQYDMEFENLETAISEEKQQQIAKMRSAMVQRRIDKERKRKQKEREVEEVRRREAVHKMNAGMAKVFREFVAKKAAESNAEKSLFANKGKSQLAAKIKAWSKKVDHERVERGGESSEVWNLKTQQEEQKDRQVVDGSSSQIGDAPANHQTLSAQDAALNQLFVRVLKVERLIEKVEKKTDNAAGGFRDVKNSTSGSVMSKTGSSQGLAQMLVKDTDRQRRSSKQF